MAPRPIRSGALLAALLLALTGLVAVTTTPAAAATAPCTQTWSWSGPASAVPVKGPDDPFGLAWFDIAVPDGRVVADLDYTIDLTAANPGNLGVQVFAPHSVNQQPQSWAWGTGGVSGSVNGSYTFDDEATTTFGGASPVPGRYRPAVQPASRLEGASAQGTWRLAIANGSTTTTATVRGFAVTLTFTTCDVDGDGVNDPSDNCPTVANVDQANLDGDSLGDLCDRDADGDGVANDIDGCPRVLSTSTTGCPDVGRQAKLAFKAKRAKFKLKITAAAPACLPAQATLWRKKPGKDAKVKRFTTNSRGLGATKAPRRRGRYYVTVKATTTPVALCSAAKTKTVRRR